MHWDNSWVNNISSCNFQTKLIFLNKVMFSFFSSNFFFFFFKKIQKNFVYQTYSRLKKFYNFKNFQEPTLDSNQSRFWVIKYSEFVIFHVFLLTPSRKKKIFFVKSNVSVDILFGARRFKKTKILTKL